MDLASPRPITILIDSPILSLDPVNATDAVSQRVLNLVFSSLVLRDAHLKIRPDLAEDIRSRGDREFSFKLKAGLRFHDGSPLMASDVMASLTAYQNKNVPAFTVKVEGPRSLIIRTSVVSPYFLQDLYFMKVFKKTNGAFVGSGRFKIQSFDVGTFGSQGVLTLERVDNSQPHEVKKLRFRYIKDDTTKYQALLHGDIDIAASSLGISKTEMFRRGIADHEFPFSQFSAVDAPGVSVQYLGFNMKNPILRNLKLRQAVAAAIDIPGILKYKYSRYATLETSPLSPYIEGYVKNPKTVSSLSLTEAQKVISDFCKVGSCVDGKLPLSLKISPSKENREMGLILAQQLAKVGIKLNVIPMELAKLLADLKRGSFELTLSRWVGIADPTILTKAFHSREIGKMNRFGYGNSEYDAAIDQALGHSALQKRLPLLHKAQEIHLRDLPVIIFWRWNNTYILRRPLKLRAIYPNGDYVAFKDLWIDQSPLQEMGTSH